MQRKHNRDADKSERHRHSCAKPSRRTLRRNAHRNSPLADEIPQPVTQMETKRK